MGHGLECDQRPDLLRCELVRANQSYDQGDEQEADLSGDTHGLLALAPSDGGFDGLEDYEA